MKTDPLLHFYFQPRKWPFGQGHVKPTHRSKSQHKIAKRIFSLPVLNRPEMATPGIARGEILCLYRSLLRTARQFCDYNIREYAKRRTIDAFRQNQNLTDPSSISAAFSDGKTQLDIAKRQAVVYSLYAPKMKSVMEINSN